MIKIKLLILSCCIVLIYLDKLSIIHKMRDYSSIFIINQSYNIINKITSYIQLITLHKQQQNQLELENNQLKQQIEHNAALLIKDHNLINNNNHITQLNQTIKLYKHSDSIIARAIIDINYLINSRLLINKGSLESIAIGNAVMNQYGLIGQINNTNEHNAQIMLITNPDFKIYLQLLNNDTKMLAEGIGNNQLIIKYINKDAKIKLGDTLVTTGLDDIYPANIQVAKITKIFFENNQFNSAICTPIVNFNKLQYVIVLNYVN